MTALLHVLPVPARVLYANRPRWSAVLSDTNQALMPFLLLSKPRLGVL